MVSKSVLFIADISVIGILVNLLIGTPLENLNLNVYYRLFYENIATKKPYGFLNCPANTNLSNMVHNQTANSSKDIKLVAGTPSNVFI